MSSESLTYAGSGVDYDPVDAFKRYAQACAYATKGNTALHGVTDVADSRGESAYLVELPDRYLAFVDEGLGTKSIIPGRIAWGKNTPLWRLIALDTVAMAVNDIITLGAQPLVASMHLQVAESSWFSYEPRWQELCTGWRDACTDAGCIWGPGETPVLKGTIVPGECSLSSACIGMIFPKERRIRGNIESGDRIVMLGSNGIGANGLTLARMIAERLPRGYATEVPGVHGDRSYGEELLTPTILYARFVDECLRNGVRIKYMVNITGHGWRKLMRLDVPYTYVIEHVPAPAPIFSFIQEKGNIETREMYQTFNMGAGFALYVHPDDVPMVCSLGYRHNIRPWNAGFIESGPRKVVIRPLGIEYAGEELQLR